MELSQGGGRENTRLLFDAYESTRKNKGANRIRPKRSTDQMTKIQTTKNAGLKIKKSDRPEKDGFKKTVLKGRNDVFYEVQRFLQNLTEQSLNLLQIVHRPVGEMGFVERVQIENGTEGVIDK